MMKYFKLFEECYLVNGADENAIYNTLSGDIFLVRNEEKDLLTRTENNMPITKACDELNIDLNIAKEYLDKFKQSNLGEYYEVPVTAEKLELVPKWIDKLFFKLPPVIGRATIGIGGLCNQKCSFCNSKDKVNKMKCLACTGIDKSEVETISLDTACKIISLLQKYKCKQVYLKDGNLLLNWKLIRDIVEHSKKSGIEKVVLNFTAAIEDKEILDYIKNNNISLILQRSIDENFDIQSLISEDSRYIGIDYTYFFLADYEMKSEVINIYNLLNQNNINNIMCDFIVHKDLNLIPKEYIKECNSLSRVSVENFSVNKKYNPCFYQSCYFDKLGNVYPCLGLLDFKYGNINDSVSTFKEENLNAFWKLNKDKLSKCSTCEVRYACGDCRSLEYAVSGDITNNSFCFKR